MVGRQLFLVDPFRRAQRIDRGGQLALTAERGAKVRIGIAQDAVVIAESRGKDSNRLTRGAFGLYVSPQGYQ